MVQYLYINTLCGDGIAGKKNTIPGKMVHDTGA